ncbi:LPS-assembly protein LptD [bacterium BMS3Abin14]|nr:LPS-assembly protein LptD [bacterium BMS3Abin14]
MRGLFAKALTILMLPILLLPIAGFAAGQELKIQSDSLQIDETRGEVRFEGSVIVRFQAAELTCNSLLLVTANSSRIKRGTAQGDVVLKNMGDRVEAQKAAFELTGGQVILTGSPRLLRGGDSINATRITYDVNTGVAVFDGPVNAVIISSPGSSQ